MAKLFQSFKLGQFELKNRVVMAPMTRSRAPQGGRPTALNALYYRQRAGAGLIISEGTSISPSSQGFVDVPGLFEDSQVEAWRPVTEGVRAQGSIFFAQLWHVGRISHTTLQPAGSKPVSSVPTRAENATCFIQHPDGTRGRVPPSQPRGLRIEEIKSTVADYARAAKNALRAGFQGVEIHGANGYLLEQFLNAGLNTRQDQYGGSVENRARFTLEVLDAVSAEIGPERTGLRLSPFGRVSGMGAFEGEAQTYLYLARALSGHGLAYIHLADQLTPEDNTIPAPFYPRFREHYKGRVILAGGYNRQRAQNALDAGIADLIAFGRPFIANPDLVARMQNNWPLAQTRTGTIYGGDAQGYTDYPPYRPAD